MKKAVSISLVFGSILLLSGCGFNFCQQSGGCSTAYTGCNTGCNTGCSTVSYASTCSSPCNRMKYCNDYDTWYQNDYN
ncbi:hypothetical protein [Legionella sp. W05-934-2]|uniref:hypothetical protein n=1 Tax=Legionella sp. W05-934-2 TaxID=1198649 RepID=UPI003463177F